MAMASTICWKRHRVDVGVINPLDDIWIIFVKKETMWGGLGETITMRKICDDFYPVDH